MKTSDVDILMLQTKSMKADDTVIGFSAALSPQFQQLDNQANEVQIYARIDELNDDVLDILAWQFNVDWYDTGSPVEVKRQAIKDALLLNKIRGTPKAVQRVIEIYFGDGQVEEWFNYGGDPYHFKVVTSNESATNEDAQLFLKTVNSVKNLRSRLESIVLLQYGEMEAYMGFVFHTVDRDDISNVTDMTWEELSLSTWSDAPNDEMWITL